MSSVRTEPPPPPPDPTSRRRSATFIAVFVALQFVIPLTYLFRDDPTDDRFTWRSPGLETTPRCETTVSVERTGRDAEPLSLEAIVHQDWIAHLHRDRRTVIDAFLRKQCEAHDAESVTLTNRCDIDPALREYRSRCKPSPAGQSRRTASR